MEWPIECSANATMEAGWTALQTAQGCLSQAKAKEQKQKLGPEKSSSRVGNVGTLFLLEFHHSQQVNKISFSARFPELFLN